MENRLPGSKHYIRCTCHCIGKHATINEVVTAAQEERGPCAESVQRVHTVTEIPTTPPKPIFAAPRLHPEQASPDMTKSNARGTPSRESNAKAVPGMQTPCECTVGMRWKPMAARFAFISG